jgi:hypothetical protein
MSNFLGREKKFFHSFSMVEKSSRELALFGMRKEGDQQLEDSQH